MNKREEFSNWCKKNMAHSKLYVGKSSFSVWGVDLDNKDKPLMVMFHGISGDYHGLVFLAHELRPDWRVAIVELPSHGKSATLKITSSDKLQAWSKEIIKNIEQSYGKPSLIFAHSFGCMAVANDEIVKKYPTVLSCPVVVPSGNYKLLAEIIIKIPNIFTRLQKMKTLSIVKGLILLKINNFKTRQRIYWNSTEANVNKTQVIRQSQMLTMALGKDIFSEIKDDPFLLIQGLNDGMVTRQTPAFLSDFFGNRMVQKHIKGGHLLPMERPEEIKRIIERYMKMEVAK